ncbi:MAG: FRG domain-containing protein [Alphaproteobacteria bacterium]|nr:FRG domain-containing protein [Alphaproteobacteria bacterium]
MKRVGEKELYVFTENGFKRGSNDFARKDAGYYVSNYGELVSNISEIQYSNRDYVFLFRGQNGDYADERGLTTIKPSMYRNYSPSKGLVFDRDKIIQNSKHLEMCEAKLIEKFSDVYGSRNEFLHDLKRNEILRWSILQHYEICKTPLLDVTSSLSVACSFASISINKNKSESESDFAHIMVLAVPALTGGASVFADEGFQVLRLSNFCPPSAARPHWQEGYLIGPYPTFRPTRRAELNRGDDVECAVRLVAKFNFNVDSFWKKSRTHRKLPKSALFPNRSDPLFRPMSDLRRECQ